MDPVLTGALKPAESALSQYGAVGAICFALFALVGWGMLVLFRRMLARDDVFMTFMTKRIEIDTKLAESLEVIRDELTDLRREITGTGEHRLGLPRRPPKVPQP